MIYFYLIVFLISMGATGCFRRIALSKAILDLPNHRSSHSTPMPRGGGIAFVALFLIIMPLYMYYSAIFSTAMAAIWVASGLIALIGFYDDLKSISSYARITGQFLIIAWLLYNTGGMPSIYIGNFLISNSLIFNFLGAIYLVWLINLYNFMDGIDGIASLEAISVCLCAILLYINYDLRELIGLPLLLTALIGGFLCWNFPKAHIFMGDVGSSFIGLILGFLSMVSASIQPNLFWCWLILLGVFIVDATYTLLYRLMSGEDIFQAHRSHAYQIATYLFKTHYLVSLGVLCINFFWLLPNALWVLKGYFFGYQGLIIAYLPLLILVILFKKIQ